jgi:hypothetical protein
MRCGNFQRDRFRIGDIDGKTEALDVAAGKAIS